MALQGMRKTIASNPGLVLLMEFWPEGLLKTGFSLVTVLSDLQDLGFVLYRIDKRTGNTEHVEDPGILIWSLTGPGYANLLAVSEDRLLWAGTPSP